MSYYKELQSKEWKFRRMEILERDDYSCVKCGYDKNLHVHHKLYHPGFMAWEYPSNQLETLCVKCHNKVHKKEKIESFVLDSPMLAYAKVVFDYEKYPIPYSERYIDSHKKKTLDKNIRNYKLSIFDEMLDILDDFDKCNDEQDALLATQKLKSFLKINKQNKLFNVIYEKYQTLQQ